MPRSRSPERRRRRRSRSRSGSRERRRHEKRRRSRSRDYEYRDARDREVRSRHRRNSHDRNERRRSRSPVETEQRHEPRTRMEDDRKLNDKHVPSGDLEKQMMHDMGFFSFGTTKGKKVEGNDVYAAKVIKKRKYRQYMNRIGGFNRPLDPVT